MAVTTYHTSLDSSRFFLLYSLTLSPPPSSFLSLPLWSLIRNGSTIRLCICLPSLPHAPSIALFDLPVFAVKPLPFMDFQEPTSAFFSNTGTHHLLPWFFLCSLICLLSVKTFLTCSPSFPSTEILNHHKRRKEMETPPLQSCSPSVFISSLLSDLAPQIKQHRDQIDRFLHDHVRMAFFHIASLLFQLFFVSPA